MEPSASPDPSAAAPVSRFKTWLKQPLGLAALAMLLLALLVWAGAVLMMGDFRDDLARRFADVETQARDGRTLARQNQEVIAALQAKVGVLEANLAQAQSQQVALDALYQEFLRSRDERLLSEIEQSLTIAAQQLQLAGNVEAALLALQDADSRLARAAQPQFLPLRKLITRDIERLRAVPGSNLSGVMLKLEGVIAGIDTLPLAFERRPKTLAKAKTPPPASPATTAWQSWLSELWTEISQLVRIQRVDHTDALLAPNQVFFLRENLKLRLVNARLSLLARDGSSFHEDLRLARSWLDKYFDAQARPVQAALTTLATLDGYDVAQGMPTINETLGAVRSFRLPRSRN